MLRIEASDCWYEIGVSQRFRVALVWHFFQMLMSRAGKDQAKPGDRDYHRLDTEARLLTERFLSDMSQCLRATLSHENEELAGIPAEALITMYLEENLEAFKRSYLEGSLDNFITVLDRGNAAPFFPTAPATAPLYCQ